MKTITPLAVALLLATASAAGAQSQPAPATPTLPGVAATTSNPNLAVASIKLDHGVRVSKIVGATVFTSDNKDLGRIDDLVMTKGDEVTLAVVSVGGFLGLGSKLVAFPYRDLKQDGDRLTLPGVTMNSLNAMPSFEY
ncbi:MAG: PRC-barrel domain-containing protein [Pseudomonadota bacterium]|nr:PRC-barrel domain-containing protein [Pseudomonadota bacterium]